MLRQVIVAPLEEVVCLSRGPREVASLGVPEVTWWVRQLLFRPSHHLLKLDLSNEQQRCKSYTADLLVEELTDQLAILDLVPEEAIDVLCECRPLHSLFSKQATPATGAARALLGMTRCTQACSIDDICHLSQLMATSPVTSR